MLDVHITYHSESRTMEVTAISIRASQTELRKDIAIATTGDNMETALLFTFDDPTRSLDGYRARVEFGIDVVDSESHAYRPYVDLGDVDTGIKEVPLSQLILSNVKCSVLPIQLAFSKNGLSVSEFYSLNILPLAINRAIDAIQEIGPTPPLTFKDVLYSVKYDKATSTFYFERADGTHIDITLSDLSEQHFEVPTFEDLVHLDKAETGDTATALDTGAWYKLYGDYAILDDWYIMSGGAIPIINGVATHNLNFYAPLESGQQNQILASNGYNEPPTWVTCSRSFVVEFTSEPTVNVKLYENDTSLLCVRGCNIICEFYDCTTQEKIELPYIISNDSTNENPLLNITVTNQIRNCIRMDVYAIPSAGVL